MVSTAKLRHLRIAPRKVRLVADLIRGKNVEEALAILQFTNKRSSLPIAKLLQSAVANADQKEGVDVDRLFVKTITVDGGPTIKRFRPRAMGRATPILKRTSHVSIALDQQG
jgi:large subunit ribosomal protein L22